MFLPPRQTPQELPLCFPVNKVNRVMEYKPSIFLSKGQLRFFQDLPKDDAAFEVIEWKVTGHIFTHNHLKVTGRLRRWSFFYNDGMVMFFFQGTIVIDGFSMVLPSLDHHH